LTDVHDGPTGPNHEPPIFVMGCPGSGNNLVALMLNAHSRISVFLGTHYYPLFARQWHRYGRFDRRRPSERLARDFLETLRVRDLGVQLPSLVEVMAELTTPSFEGVLQAVLRAHARRSGKTRSGERTSRHFAYLPQILERYPASPVIFTMRDPRDVAYFLVGSLGRSLEGICSDWTSAFDRCHEASRPVHVVRFEDLLTEPEPTVAGICSFLGEDFEPGMLDFYQHAPAHFHRIEHHRKLASALDPSMIGRHRGLDAATVAYIEDACARGMAEMNYPRSSPPSKVALSSGAARRRSLWRQITDRIRYLGTDAHRWRVALTSWKIRLRVWALYLLRLGFIRYPRSQAR